MTRDELWGKFLEWWEEKKSAGDQADVRRELELAFEAYLQGRLDEALRIEEKIKTRNGLCGRKY